MAAQRTRLQAAAPQQPLNCARRARAVCRRRVRARALACYACPCCACSGCAPSCWTCGVCSVRLHRAAFVRRRHRHHGGAPARALCWPCACLRCACLRLPCSRCVYLLCVRLLCMLALCALALPMLALRAPAVRALAVRARAVRLRAGRVVCLCSARLHRATLTPHPSSTPAT